ncbi:substrate-binding domain-containing protein [Mesorhizobium sp. AR07]|uniref:substrate-binding domain-containing protein n=1 Tax=Mesorhizobium sp. AR07 TaxID=2865838 RepID=UPI00215FEFEE|nr:substrate-binding domain-containing protein [Mesorhizobium sp. AR07]UVK44564.1 substrate-binding domain-containing protein [Mesorhizobium sp. AR07]
MATPSDSPAIEIYAAGSLRHVLPALVSAFSEMTGVAVETRHGPAGLLRERIEQGDRPDLFLSASIDHPARLAELGLSGPPVVFARNTMAAVARRAANMTSGNFVDRLLDPAIRIGTSTPLKDPSGDYAWAIFRRVEQVVPGAFDVLDAKAMKLVGASETAPTPRPYDPVANGLADGSIDVFLGYLTGLMGLVAELPDVEIVDIPQVVNVMPEYGLAAIENCRAEALSFALFVMSAAGQLLLRQFGFTPVALPQQA